MKKLLAFAFFSLAMDAQTPKESIVIRVTDSAGVLTTAKITGVPAAAGLDSLMQFLATQVDCTGTPQICTARYTDAADFTKRLLVKVLEDISPKYPSASTAADVAVITAKIAELEAKRKALFDAARTEK